MQKFIATQFDANTCEETGETELYLAETLEKAVEYCLYTRQLKNGKAFVGKTGRVVYDGFGLAYTLTQERVS